MAVNDPVESPVTTFTISEPEVVMPEVILVSPADGSVIEGPTTELTWRPEPESMHLTFEVYLDTVNPPVEMVSEGSDNERSSNRYPDSYSSCR